ncbi:MAG: ChbG/HpnK family deacetylase [Acidobacteriaceae bacterium]|nr:ChbG/HpnK family deacetylase [Acidobacteriaceae bacterium]
MTLPRLIINADDFGLTPGINRAIEELHQAGALSSATLMANGPAFNDAVAIAKRNPGLGIGCHVVLTDGMPVSHPHDVPTLLGPDGKTFRSSLVDFFLAVLRGRVSEADVAREAQAQISKLQRAGLDVTHVDTHKHTHMLPKVARPLLFVAERCRVGAIRSPFEDHWSLAVSHSDAMRKLQVRVLWHLRKKFVALPQIRSGAVATTDGTLGISATGRLDGATLEQLLRVMPEGAWELVCHPGYNDRDLDAVTTRLRSSREVERDALLAAFADGRSSERVELLHYGALGPFARLREVGQFEPNTGEETRL